MPEDWTLPIARNRIAWKIAWKASVLLLAHCLQLSFANIARAAPDHTADPSRGRVDHRADADQCRVSRRCKSLHRRGHAALQAGNLIQALTFFEQQHASCPTAQSAWDLAAVAYHHEDHAAVVRWMGAALADQRCAFRRTEREDAEQALAQAEQRVARFLAMPSHAQLFVDGRRADPEPDGSWLVATGDHSLEVRADGHVTERIDARITGGERMLIKLPLRPAVRRIAQPSPPVPQAGFGTQDAAWIAAGSALALGAAGAISYALARNAHADLACQPDCIPGTPVPPAADNWLLASRLSLGLAIAAASTSVVLLLWPHEGNRPGQASAHTAAPRTDTVRLGLGHLRLAF